MRFEDVIRQAGLRPREMYADGRIRRCATESHPHKRNGWFVWHLDGRGYWGDWTTGSGSALGSWTDESVSHTPPSRETLDKLRAQRDQERRIRQQAMRSAREFWHRARPLNRIHPYIDRKGLTPLGCAGLRQHDGLLVVPVWNGEFITSIQTINAEGRKLFWPDAVVEGGCYVLKRDRSALTVFAEGLSTGLALYQSVRHCSVVVCFNAGNLLKVTQRIKPTGSVVFAADNDHKTLAKRGFNPGIQFATNAAELIGAGIAWPKGIEGSDWADALREGGEGSAKRIEREILAAAKYVTRTAS